MVNGVDDVPREAIAAFCAKWRVTELAVFGSVLRDDFRPESDVDVLVSFAPDARIGYFGFGAMQEELGGIFGRKVHLVSRRGVERSRSAFRRSQILSSAEVIHAAG